MVGMVVTRDVMSVDGGKEWAKGVWVTGRDEALSKFFRICPMQVPRLTANHSTAKQSGLTVLSTPLVNTP